MGTYEGKIYVNQ